MDNHEELVSALRECVAYFERELADDPTLIESDFAVAYKAARAALAQEKHPQSAPTPGHIPVKSGPF
jgi:hypothetical protein